MLPIRPSRLLACGLALCVCVTGIWAQELPVYERERFDQLVLTPAAGGQTVDVFSLDADVRRGPDDRELRVRLILYPDREYDIAWRDIAAVKRFEQIILDEAERLIDEKKLDEAYRHLEALQKIAPTWPGFDRALTSFLKADARESFRNGRLLPALAVLAEIQKVAPADRSVTRGMETIVQRLFDQRFAEENFEGARGIVGWAARPDHGLDLSDWVVRARQQLQDHAASQRREAANRLAAGDYRAARMLADAALDAWPTDGEAAALARSIDAEHPRIVVGVTRRADPTRLLARHDWASRRVARLLQRDLMEVHDYGADGGRYVCPYGHVTVEPDNQRVSIDLDPKIVGSSLTGYDIAETLLLPPAEETNYAPLGSVLITSVRVEDVYVVRVDLRSPVLQPRGLLTVSLPAEQQILGSYDVVGETDKVLELKRAQSETSGITASFELAERWYASTSEMAEALRRGDIDVIDRLTPWQSQRVARDPDITVNRYRFPSQHFLIPNQQRPLMANRNARRAIAYGVSRQAILQQDLLGGQSLEGCAVLSGPFTQGRSPDDPVAYATNDQVSPRPYNPSLAITLYAVAQNAVARQQDQEAESAGPGEWQPLILVHAEDELITSMASSVARYLNAIGIQVKLRALPPGTGRPTGDWDLWYADVVMVEPITDINWLIGEQGVARGASPYLETALRQLAVVTRWTDARVLLQEIHRLVYDELVLIPLWQLTDYFAHRNDVMGLSREPATLYQDVEAWRLN